MMDSPDPMDEIRASFFIECEELLETLQDALGVIENEEHDDETINIVFRAVHSIKGGAGAFGLEDLVRFSHAFETTMDAVRSKKIKITEDLTSLSYRCADHLSDLVRANRENTPLADDAGQDLFNLLKSTLGTDSDNLSHEEPAILFEPMALELNLDIDDISADAPLDADIDAIEKEQANEFTIKFTPHFELFESGNEPFILLSRLKELGEYHVEFIPQDIKPLTELEIESPKLSWIVTLKGAMDENEIISVFEFVEGICDLEIRLESDGASTEPPLEDPQPLNPESKTIQKPVETPVTPIQKKSSATTVKPVVRVELDRVERLVNLVGELVINQAMLAQSLEDTGLPLHSNTMVSVEEYNRLTREIQDGVMMIRAQPVKPLFQRMSRIVRESSGAVKKDVRLLTNGENTEVDKTVIERLADPLTHMLRNAVDHGLEDAKTRLENGKPAQGTITLSAFHKSGRVIIEVSDDGAGINREKVYNIALQKGLIEPNWEPSETEIDNLLFLPGFSTANVVSDLSGRGVGLDVVRNAIQALGGRITISSRPGQGSTFSISLPLTLAVLDGMVVKVANETLVLPLNFISETMTMFDDNYNVVSPDLSVVRIRDGYIPICDLGQALGYRDKLSSYEDRIALIIETDEKYQAALIVDDIQDQRQVVIKGLDESCYCAPGIAAATILGDGKIALILDPTDIIVTSQTAPALLQA